MKTSAVHEYSLRKILPHHLFVLSVFLIAGTVVSEPDRSYIGIHRFTISVPAMEYYQSLDVLLFQRLNFEVLPHGVYRC